MFSLLLKVIMSIFTIYYDTTTSTKIILEDKNNFGKKLILDSEGRT